MKKDDITIGWYVKFMANTTGIFHEGLIIRKGALDCTVHRQGFGAQRVRYENINSIRKMPRDSLSHISDAIELLHKL